MGITEVTAATDKTNSAASRQENDTCIYIGEMCAEMSRMAKSANQHYLAHLLELATTEAFGRVVNSDDRRQ